MQPTKSAVYDPIRFCIFTTIALLAWLLGAPVAVMLMSGMGLWAYVQAWQQGLRTSKCFLRDPRLVMGYLAGAFLLGAGFSLQRLLTFLS